MVVALSSRSTYRHSDTRIRRHLPVESLKEALPDSDLWTHAVRGILLKLAEGITVWDALRREQLCPHAHHVRYRDEESHLYDTAHDHHVS